MEQNVDRLLGELTAHLENFSHRLDEHRDECRMVHQRIEDMLARHVASDISRISSLERWRAWMTWAISVLSLMLLAMIAWLKGR